jgi:hypothetical protein
LQDISDHSLHDISDRIVEGEKEGEAKAPAQTKEKLLKPAPGNDEGRNSSTKFAEHLPEGKEFKFRVVVMQAFNVSGQYGDIFAQFKCVFNLFLQPRALLGYLSM